MKIWAKTKEFSEGKFLVVRHDGSAPHWPHFVLGARDPCAPAALRAYVVECAKQPVSDAEYMQSVLDLADDFERYRASQGDGDPFAPPHRRDDQSVLAAMRGEPASICVRPDRTNVQK